MEEVVSEELVAFEGESSSATLFRTDDPAVVVERATAAANVLKDVLEKNHLTSSIRGRDHVRVEGWMTLGAMLGVTPVCTWTREREDGWEARVEARTLDGRVVGAAEAMCTRDERRWATADDYAIRSMAQTRATSKALGSVLRFVITLAGYDGTPAEEMDWTEGTAVERPPTRQVTADAPQPTEALATPAQQRMIWARARDAGLTDDDVRAIFEAIAGVEHTDRIPRQTVDQVLMAISSRADELAEGGAT